jgi:hypothetical protein
MLARKSSSEIASTRPSGWNGGICEINYCYDVVRDATLVINKSCERTELQFPSNEEQGTCVRISVLEEACRAPARGTHMPCGKPGLRAG